MNRLAPPGFVLLLAAAPAGQVQFEALARQHLPPDRQATAAVVLGDFDGDGDLDLIVAHRVQRQFFRNDGDARYVEDTAGRLPTTFYGRPNAMAAPDLDGDGDLDLVVAADGQTQVNLNDGSGVFTDVTPSHVPAASADTLSLAAGDVDGDGDPDLVLGNSNLGSSGCNWLYLNDGAGVFSDATAGRLPVEPVATGGVGLGDVDGDGDLDLVTANGLLFSALDRLYLNDGTGVFTDVTATRLPAKSRWSYDVLMEDIDGDGDLDLLLGGVGGMRVFANDGTGTYAEESAARWPAGASGAGRLMPFDFDGDGDRDLAAVSTSATAERLFANDGAGVFTDVTAARLPPPLDPATAVATGDVDGDGDQDLLFGNGPNHPDKLLLNNGTGMFHDTGVPALPASGAATRALATGDVDGDGDLDLVFADGAAATARLPNRLLRNDRGRFVDVTATQLPNPGDPSRAVALGDVDGDGDLDLVVGNRADQNRLYRNDGAGRFTDVTAARLPARTERTEALALGDVDGDGDLDLVFGNDNHQNRLLHNDGAGGFTDGSATGMPPDFDNTRAVAFGDVDGDGDLDLVMANGLPGVAFPGRQNELYRNDGAGMFAEATATALPAVRDVSQAVALGDVDGDGDLDLVFGNVGRDVLYLNDGAGVFTGAAAQLQAIWTTHSVVFGDLDGDGDLDLLTGSAKGAPNQVLQNDGTGVFADVTATLLQGGPNSEAYAVGFADVDGDGDPDLLFGNEEHNVLLHNLQQHLHAPLLAFPGRRYDLEVYARRGAQADTALLFLSPAGAQLAIPPFGTFGLDPSLLLLLPTQPIPQPSGSTRFELTLPAVPSTVGAPLYAQALVVDTIAPADSRLTPVTLDHVRR